MSKVHGVLYLERVCQNCDKRVTKKLFDYGLLDFETLDEKVGNHSFEIRPFPCSFCGREEFPENAVMYNEAEADPDLQLIFRKALGSKEIPVIGNAGPYGVFRSEEEQAEYDRGLEKIPDVWEKGKEVFWERYYAWALDCWKKVITELGIKEMSAGCQAVGVSLLPASASVAAWRKFVRKNIQEKQKSDFWQAANTEMVEKDILWMFPDYWDIEKLVKRYGRERIRYVMLHVPLPEELEKWRTEAIAKLVKKKTTGDTGVLFERIGQLGKELDRQRRRSQELSQQIRKERQQRAELEGKLSVLRQDLEAEKEGGKVFVRDADDIRKIRSLKGLIRELRAEVERLNGLIPEPVEDEPGDQQMEEVEVADLSHLEGKTVAVFGRLGEAEEVEGIHILYHDGDRVDLAMGRVAREADIWVILTRLVSHRLMWRLREEAADRGKEIRFVRETGVRRILEQI